MKYAVCTLIGYLPLSVFVEVVAINAKLACDNININYVYVFVRYIEWCILYSVYCIAGIAKLWPKCDPFQKNNGPI